jgi:hypothetical protein
MVETRDEETGEIIKTLVDKVRRHKVTRLKKTILAARKLHKKPKLINKVAEDGFETVESGDESSEIAEELELSSEEEIVVSRLSVFGDLDMV